jgi:leader peptidase (prepilin peptidase)/N-methyltransferase
VNWLDRSQLLTAITALPLGVLAGWFVPRLIARLPEPEPEEPDDAADPAHALPPAPPKVAYVDLASRPGLAWKCALGTGIVAAVLAASVGFTGALVVLMPLVPIGVALAVIDWHTTLLPTRIIAPTYAVTVVAVLIAGAIDADRDAVVRSAISWAAMGGFFVLLWFVYPRGMGYGDVRLSGVLGLALGYVGWAALVVGAYGAFVIGGVVGGLLGAIKVIDRKRFPFGPFMLIAAVLGVVWGPWIATSLGY